MLETCEDAKRKNYLPIPNREVQPEGSLFVNTLKAYLKAPDKLFRRVRDEHGILHLSKKAKAYHPGRGVYRSSFKNARRLAATECNMAYRTADHLRWQELDFVVGIKVQLSNNHTCLGKDGKPHPFHDICDELVGLYPKTFKFVGWHPHCRCFATSVLKTKEELQADNKRILQGKEPLPNSANEVTKVPKAFVSWVEKNKERAKSWANMPYFVRDNAGLIKINFEVNTYTDEEKKFTRARKTKIAMERAQEEFSVLYPNIPNTELAAIHHYTRHGGNYRQLNKQMENGTLTDFNRAAQTLITQGLEKLPTYQGIVYRGMIIKRKEFERIFGGGKGKDKTDSYLQVRMKISLLTLQQ